MLSFAPHYVHSPTAIISRQNYSDVLVPSASIEIYLPVYSQITLKLFDTGGKEVQTVMENKECNAGTHHVSLDSVTLNESVYLYRLIVKTEKKTFVDVKALRLSRSAP